MSDYEGRSRPPVGARTLTEGYAESGAVGKHTLTESYGAPVVSGPGKRALTQGLSPVTAAPDQEFVAQWFRANVRVGNKEIQAIQKMPPEQREVLMTELKRRYGHEYVQRGIEGKLDDSAPAERSQQRLDATEYWAKYGEKTMLVALQRATSELEFEVVGPGLSFSPDERSAFVKYGFGWRINDTQPHIVSQLLDCPLLPLIDSARVVDDDQQAADAYEPAVVERILERLGLGIRRATERLALPYAKPARARSPRQRLQQALRPRRARRHRSIRRSFSRRRRRSARARRSSTASPTGCAPARSRSIRSCSAGTRTPRLRAPRCPASRARVASSSRAGAATG